MNAIEGSTAHPDELNDKAIQGRKAAEGENEADVVEFAGQVKEALTPVKAPALVKDRLRLELVEIAEQHVRQDMVIESTSRRRGWAIGAAIGSVMALAGGIVCWMRTRLVSRTRSKE